MYKLLFTALLAISGLTNSPLSSNSENREYHKHESEEPKESMVSLSARIVRNHASFELLMKNEKRYSTYSLVKIIDNDSIVSIGIRSGVPNSIDQPILYSFFDSDVPDNDCTYELYRIAEESKLLMRWDFCCDQKRLSTAADRRNISLND